MEESKKVTVFKFYMRNRGVVEIAGTPGEELTVFGVDDSTAGWLEVGSSYAKNTGDDNYYAVGGVAKADCLAWAMTIRDSL